MKTSLPSVVAMLVVGACSGGEPAPTATEPPEREMPTTDQRTGDTLELPMREGPRRQTTGSADIP